MRMGIVVVAIVMGLTAMSMRAEAQGGASCLTVANAGAPFGDAATAVQELRVRAGQCCQSNSGGFCSVLVTSGNAAATICGPLNYCPSCADVGNSLNAVLAQCNVLNEVQGVFSPDGTSQKLFYLTSASNHP